MDRASSARLVRLERDAPDPAEEAWERRVWLRWNVMCATLIHDMAAAAGRDPATIDALRDGLDAAAELAALGDNEELWRADQGCQEAFAEALHERGASFETPAARVPQDEVYI